MRAFDIPSMHPSRTRGKGSIVSTGERNPFLVKMGGNSTVEDGENAYRDSEKGGEMRSLIRNLDRVSSWISLANLIVAIGFGFWPPKGTLNDFASPEMRFRTSFIPLWKENMFVVPPATEKGLAVYDAFQSLETSLDGFCEKKEFNLHYENRTWDDKGYIGSAVIEPAGSFSPWVVLIWIFLVSFVFQGARYESSEPSVRGDTPSGPLMSPDISDTPFNLWKWWDYFKYNPLRPDFWRWLEYALTAPFQILLIATSVFINNEATLWNLMGLQGALVLLGYLNEKRIDSFYKRAIKRDKAVSEKSTYKGYKLAILYVSCLAFFVLIWVTIMIRFYRQDDNLNKCDYAGASIPGAVYFLVWSQMVLFASFGVVQGLQIWTMRGDLQDFRAETEKSNIAKIRAERWATAALRYSFLSVTAKTVLEVGFIMVVYARERMTEVE
tara:strand:+ start:13039 stop:14355 length:1317 start_codon:yes stop_codon:yes gene_type:complete